MRTFLPGTEKPAAKEFLLNILGRSCFSREVYMPLTPTIMEFLGVHRLMYSGTYRDTQTLAVARGRLIPSSACNYTKTGKARCDGTCSYPPTLGVGTDCGLTGRPAWLLRNKEESCFKIRWLVVLSKTWGWPLTSICMHMYTCSQQNVNEQTNLGAILLNCGIFTQKNKTPQYFYSAQLNVKEWGRWKHWVCIIPTHF